VRGRGGDGGGNERGIASHVLACCSAREREETAPPAAASKKVTFADDLGASELNKAAECQPVFMDERLGEYHKSPCARIRGYSPTNKASSSRRVQRLRFWVGEGTYSSPPAQHLVPELRIPSTPVPSLKLQCMLQSHIHSPSITVHNGRQQRKFWDSGNGTNHQVVDFVHNAHSMTARLTTLFGFPPSFLRNIAQEAPPLSYTHAHSPMQILTFPMITWLTTS
jgi:hypothetical protein